MLQPKQSTDDQALMVTRLIWGALSLSMVMYGFVLFQLGKVSAVYVPAGNLQPLEMLALGANAIAIFTFLLHKNQIQGGKEFQKKMPLYIICWALNELIVLVAFVATFIGESGNGFFYLANFTVGIFANILTFPRK